MHQKLSSIIVIFLSASGLVVAVLSPVTASTPPLNAVAQAVQKPLPPLSDPTKQPNEPLGFGVAYHSNSIR